MRLLDSLEKYILLFTVFLLPIVFLPIFPNPFDTAKIAVLALGISLVIVVKAIKTIVNGSLETSTGSFDIPVILIALAYLLSAVLKTPNKMDAFFLPGTATIILEGAVLYFLIIISSGAKNKKALSLTLLASSTISALFSLFASSGILAKIAVLPSYAKETGFSVLGGNLPAAIFFGLTSILGIGLILSEKELIKKVFALVSSLIILLGLFVNILNLLPNKKTVLNLPPFQSSWVVAVETLKGSSVFGVGPGNYLSAFNRFRPLSYNNGELWNIRFTTASNFPLSALTQTGLLGLVGIAILFFVVGKLIAKRAKEMFGENKKVDFAEASYLLALTAAFVVLLLLPTNLVLVISVFVLLSLNSDIRSSKINLTTFTPGTDGSMSSSRILPIILGVPFIVAAGALFFFGGRALSAESQFNRGLIALNNNDGKGTYDLLRQAISLNPYVDRYHATYAQINLALARAMAQSQNLSDSDKDTITQLIQQAILEGKATVTLNIERSGNWELLARIYQSVMPFAQGADQFAIQTYTQAVVLDPISPDLRISLGGVYYSLGRFDEAIRVFELAVLSKPDLANAHYNLGLALKEKGQVDDAIDQINAVLSLVDKDSQDYQIAKTELDNLEKNKVSNVTGESENLTPPAEAAKPVIKPPLELPQEAIPPATTTP
jgi:tetratricopeptide (TPR) repeat protein